MPHLTKKYKYAVIAVDVAIFTINKGKLQVLLIEMKKKPYTGFWAAPGGLIKINESLEQGAKRVLREKAGVRNVYLEQLYAFGKVGRDPFGRVVSVAYYALIPSDGLAPKTTQEYAGVKWFPVDQLPRLAYDHSEILKKAIHRLQRRLTQTNIACNLLPEKFSLSELQKDYEIILGKKLDKRNFRKKILSLSLVEKTAKKRSGAANRPANLYRFKSRRNLNIEIL